MPDATSESPLQELGTVVEIRTAFSRQDRAAACARRLIDARLAACVQIDGPVTSVYRWQGEVETAEEYRCTCKTSSMRAAACMDDILANYEYETPEVIATVVRASISYAAWVQAEVAKECTAGNECDVT
ncbi:MAG: divalent-cation tolerance protein CutA [Planctomycetia bacterium]